MLRNRVLNVLLLGMVLSGCGKQAGTAPTPAGRADRASKVTHVVFVDRQECCECTRKRIDATWTALQAALGEGSKVVVDRFHIDTQANLVAPYREMKAMVAAPAVYFLDADEKLVDMLQGKVSQEAIAAVLAGRDP